MRFSRIFEYLFNRPIKRGTSIKEILCGSVEPLLPLRWKHLTWFSTSIKDFFKQCSTEIDYDFLRFCGIFDTALLIIYYKTTFTVLLNF